MVLKGIGPEFDPAFFREHLVEGELPQFSDTYRLGFSCSSQYDKDRCWMLLWHIDDPEYPNWDRVCLQGYDKKAYWNVRPFFAF